MSLDEKRIKELQKQVSGLGKAPSAKSPGYSYKAPVEDTSKIDDLVSRVSALENEEATEVDTKGVIDALRTLKGNDRLDISNLRNGENLAILATKAVGKKASDNFNMDDQRWHGGASGFSGTSGTSGTGLSGTSGYSGTSGFSGANPGASGTSGSSGVGTSGTSGFSGTSGTSGFSGTSGTSGFSGTSGLDGLASASGISGYSGTSGTSGFSGTSGLGLSGTSGTSGTSGLGGGGGTSGTSGFSGTSGTSGFSGTSGTSGYSGTSGKSGFSGIGTSGFSGTSGATSTSGFSGTSGTSGYSGTSGTSGFSGTSGTGLSGTSGTNGQAPVVRTTTVTSSATVTPNWDTTDEETITAQAAALTLANPSGTPVNGQKLIIRIKDNGSAQTIGYGSQYRASSDLALPTTTILSKTLYMGFIWNSTDTKMDMIASLNNF